MTVLTAPVGTAMPSRLRFDATFFLPGHTFSVRSSTQEVIDYLRQVFFAFPWNAGSFEAEPDFTIHKLGAGWQVESVDNVPAYFSTALQAADFVQLCASQAALSRTHEHVAIHAAGVSRNGTALIFAGPSGAGKSTLTAALLTRGYRYLSDEAVFLSSSNSLVQGFPRALGMLPDGKQRLAAASLDQALTAGMTSLSGPPEGKYYMKPADLGAELETGAVPVKALLMMRRPTAAARRAMTACRLSASNPDAPPTCRPRLIPLDRSPSIPLLLHQVFASGPADLVLSAIIRLVNGASVYRIQGACPQCSADFIRQWDDANPCAALELRRRDLGRG